jgi:hypothetical protein
MIGEINRKLPEDSQIGYFGFHTAKFIRIRDEYMRHYPNGKLLLLQNYLSACAIVLFILSAAVLFHLIR